MKRSLLALAMLSGFSMSAFADEITLEVKEATDIKGTLVEETTSAAKHYQPLESLNLSGYTVTGTKGTNDLAMYYSTKASGSDVCTIRFYKKGGSMTLTAPEGVTMTKIVYTGKFDTAEGKKCTPEVGDLTIDNNTTATWEGASNAVTIKSTDDSGTTQVSQMVVTYTVGEAPAVANVKISPNGGEVEAGTEVTLSCSTADVTIFYTTDGSDPEVSSDLAPEEGTFEYQDPIEVNEEMTIKAVAYAADGSCSQQVVSASFTIKAPVESMTLKQAFSTLENGAEFEMSSPLVVVFNSEGKYVYVYDAAENCYGLIYDNSKGLASLGEGDVIKAGWSGKMTIYYSLRELVPNSAAALEVGGSEEVPEPTVVTAENLDEIWKGENQAQYIVMKDVVVSEEGACTIGDAIITVYNRFGLQALSAGTYDITGFIAYYTSKGATEPTVQLYYTHFVEAASSLNGVAAESVKAPAKYYNLQGVQISNPRGGAFIKVQDGKSSKVML